MRLGIDKKTSNTCDEHVSAQEACKAWLIVAGAYVLAECSLTLSPVYTRAISVALIDAAS